jgi:hypothetical protein
MYIRGRPNLKDVKISIASKDQQKPQSLSAEDSASLGRGNHLVVSHSFLNIRFLQKSRSLPRIPTYFANDKLHSGDIKPVRTKTKTRTRSL